jgi:hypothetical protein
MAAASRTDAETAQKQARLQALQKTESERRRGTELAAKERQKHETWKKVLDNHEKEVKAAAQPKESKPAVVAATPKILQPVSIVFASS